MTVRAFRGTILAKPRLDIHASFSPVMSGVGYDWIHPNRLAVAEVVSIGGGELWGPSSTPPAEVGQCIMFEQRQVQHDFVDNGEDRIVLPFKAACVGLRQDTETGQLLPEAIGHWFMSQPEVGAAEKVATPKALIVRPGQVDKVPTASGPELSIQRVHSVGLGTYVKGGLSRPECKVGELVLFSPVMSSELRMYGQIYSITPWSEALLGIGRAD